MTEAEYEHYAAGAVELLAAEQAAAFEQPLDEARREAARAFERLLPRGKPGEPDQYLYSLWNGSETIGYAWVHLRGPDRKTAYVLDFYLHPEMRGRGVGAAAFEALERRMRDIGADSVSLSVFRQNEVARRLYEKLGFRVVAFLMSKKL